MDFSQPAQPTAHFRPYYTAGAAIIEGRLLLQGGHNHREYGILLSLSLQYDPWNFPVNDSTDLSTLLKVQVMQLVFNALSLRLDR